MTAAQRYEAHGPTGFLKPFHEYRIDANGHQIFASRNTRDSHRAFTTWSNIAPEKNIQLFRDGQLVESHKPKTQ